MGYVAIKGGGGPSKARTPPLKPCAPQRGRQERL